MSMTDPIADFLARIRNGISARKQLVECPRSNIKLRIASGQLNPPDELGSLALALRAGWDLTENRS